MAASPRLSVVATAESVFRAAVGISADARDKDANCELPFGEQCSHAREAHRDPGVQNATFLLAAELHAMKLEAVELGVRKELPSIIDTAFRMGAHEYVFACLVGTQVVVCMSRENTRFSFVFVGPEKYRVRIEENEKSHALVHRVMWGNNKPRDRTPPEARAAMQQTSNHPKAQPASVVRADPLRSVATGCELKNTPDCEWVVLPNTLASIFAHRGYVSAVTPYKGVREVTARIEMLKMIEDLSAVASVSSVVAFGTHKQSPPGAPELPSANFTSPVMQANVGLHSIARCDPHGDTHIKVASNQEASMSTYKGSVSTKPDLGARELSKAVCDDVKACGVPDDEATRACAAPCSNPLGAERLAETTRVLGGMRSHFVTHLEENVRAAEINADSMTPAALDRMIAREERARLELMGIYTSSRTVDGRQIDSNAETMRARTVAMLSAGLRKLLTRYYQFTVASMLRAVCLAVPVELLLRIIITKLDNPIMAYVTCPDGIRGIDNPKRGTTSQAKNSADEGKQGEQSSVGDRPRRKRRRGDGNDDTHKVEERVSGTQKTEARAVKRARVSPDNNDVNLGTINDVAQDTDAYAGINAESGEIVFPVRARDIASLPLFADVAAVIANGPPRELHEGLEAKLCVIEEALDALIKFVGTRSEDASIMDRLLGNIPVVWSAPVVPTTIDDHGEALAKSIGVFAETFSRNFAAGHTIEFPAGTITRDTAQALSALKVEQVPRVHEAVVRSAAQAFNIDVEEDALEMPSARSSHRRSHSRRRRSRRKASLESSTSAYSVSTSNTSKRRRQRARAKRRRPRFKRE